jgi:DNA modification methylase
MEIGQKKLTHEQREKLQKAASEKGFDNYLEYLLYLHKEYGEYSEKRQNLAGQEIIDQEDKLETFFETEKGKIYHGDSSFLMSDVLQEKSIDLIMTSPPFALVRKKDYGNEDADRYLEWFKKFSRGFRKILKDSGSLVIDIGGAWKKGKPTRSLYHFELLIMLCREYGFHLIQEFFWWNPSKLPSPAEWVNVRRIRVKDAVNCVWWLSKTPYPKASNKRVLSPYSGSMKKLLKDGYKAKLRPSGHDISTKFQKDNRGAIPPNLLAIANTESNSSYQRYCRKNGYIEHPARFPSRLPAYFIKMLTDSGDIVFDPFGGSCVTGAVAESMGRNWICCELDKDYIQGAIGRFENLNDTLDLIEASPEKPYEIFPPTFGLFTEKESPLAKDGGKKRPKKGEM